MSFRPEMVITTSSTSSIFVFLRLTWQTCIFGGRDHHPTKPTLRYTTGYDGISWNIMGYTGIMCVYIYKYLCMICVHIYIHCV